MKWNVCPLPKLNSFTKIWRKTKIIDPVKLNLCEYQAIEHIHPYPPVRENGDSIIEVSPYEALVINEASKIGAIESHPNPVPQQDTLAADQVPHSIPEAQVKRDYILIGPGKGVNLQDMDHWSVFTENLRYTIPEVPAPGFDIQGQ